MKTVKEVFDLTNKIFFLFFKFLFEASLFLKISLKDSYFFSSFFFFFGVTST